MTLSDFDTRVLAALPTGHESAASARAIAATLAAAPAEVEQVARKVASALGRLRARGLVHRDSITWDGTPEWCRYDSDSVTGAAREALLAAEAARPSAAQAQALDCFGPDGVFPRETIPAGYTAARMLAVGAQADGQFYRAAALWRIVEARAKTAEGRRAADHNAGFCRKRAAQVEKAIRTAPQVEKAIRTAQAARRREAAQVDAARAAETDSLSENDFQDWAAAREMTTAPYINPETGEDVQTEAQEREAAQVDPETLAEMEEEAADKAARRGAVRVVRADESGTDEFGPRGLTWDSARGVYRTPEEFEEMAQSVDHSTGDGPPPSARTVALAESVEIMRRAGFEAAAALCRSKAAILGRDTPEGRAAEALAAAFNAQADRACPKVDPAAQAAPEKAQGEDDKGPRYRVESFDVCTAGFERLRSYSEFILTTPVESDSNPDELLSELLGDVDSCMRPDHFDFDAARAAVRDWFESDLRPLFARPNPFNLESPPEGEDSDEWTAEGPALVVYVRDLAGHEFSVY